MENTLVIDDNEEATLNTGAFDRADSQIGSSSTNQPMDTDEPQTRSDSILGFDTLDLNEVDGITSSRLKRFQDLLHQVTSRSDFDGQKFFNDLLEDINNDLPEDQKFSKDEAEAALNLMAKKNK
ncbi:5273_t:CDS:2, partial [Acaulospora colombiana]